MHSLKSAEGLCVFTLHLTGFVFCVAETLLLETMASTSLVVHIRLTATTPKLVRWLQVQVTVNPLVPATEQPSLDQSPLPPKCKDS